MLQAFVTQSPLFINLLSALSNGPLENANLTLQNYLGPILSGAPFHLHVRLHYFSNLLLYKLPFTSNYLEGASLKFDSIWEETLVT
jgi:hypothetical protein